MAKIIEIKSVNLDDYLFVDDAAEILGVKEGVIRNYLSLGKLTTFKFKKRTFLSRVEVDSWKSKID